MENNSKTIRLNEQEFQEFIKSVVIQTLNEGKFGDAVKRVGKGIGKAALYGALGAGSLYAIDKGLENQDKYEQDLNRQAKEMQAPSQEEVGQWLLDHDMEDTPENRDWYWNYVRESKQNARIGQIIRESIQKIL